jgi:lipopolysaccharide export system protein LptA
MILFGSLLILGLILGVVSLLPDSVDSGLTGIDVPKPQQITRDPGGTSGVDVVEHSSLQWSDKETGEIRVLINAESITKRDDGSYVMTQPFVEMRQDSGQRIYLSADGAEMWLEELAGGMTVHHGRLFSTEKDRRNVRVYFDRTKIGERPSFNKVEGETAVEKIEKVFAQLDARRTDMIRIWAEDISFDLDNREVETDHSFLLFADEGDINGHGLLVRWNETPQELRLLRVKRGRQIKLYNFGDGENFIPLPGGEQTTAPETLDSETDLTMSDEALEMNAGAGGETVVDATPSDETVEEAELPVLTDELGEDLAEVTPGPLVMVDDKPKARNKLSAVFNDSVTVDAPMGRLWGATSLRIDVELEEGLMGGLREEVESDVSAVEEGAPDEKPSDRLTDTTPRSTERNRIVDTEDKLTASDDEDTEVSDNAGDVASDGGGKEPIVITWRGMLEIRPEGYTPTPSQDRYAGQATGNDVHIADDRVSIACNRITYRNEDQRIQVAGSAGDPARLYLDGGQELVCQEIDVDLPAGKIKLLGPGMLGQGTGEEAGPAGMTGLGQGSTLWVGWQGEAVATIGTGERLNDAGDVEEYQYFDNAIFRDDVVLTQQGEAMRGIPADVREEDLPDYDFVRCDIMRVWMKQKDGGDVSSITPESAVAKGNVLAQAEESLIRAGNVEMFFDEVLEEGDDGDEPSLEIRPSIIVARGDVHVIDRGDPTQPIEAAASIAQIDVIDWRAVLFGVPDTPAAISQGPNILSGQEIALNQKTMSAIVDGAGMMRLVTDTDMSGNPLDETRPVDVTWTQRMEFFGQKNEANFIGDVDMQSLGEEMQCQQLRLVFEKDEDADEEVAVSAEDNERRMGLSIDRYGNRKLSMIMAFNEIAIQSTRLNETGQLIQRLKVTGDRLLYDAPVNELSIFGQGTLLAEDYKIDLDASGQPKRRADSTGNMTLQSPTQTAILWTREMQILQDDRQVNVSGQVQMIHRSGNQVAKDEALNAPDWGDLDTGRKSNMTCDRLTANFAPAPETDESGEAESGDPWESGPKLGPLEFFEATGQVSMADGDIQIVASQMTYDERDDTVVLLGSLPGKPAADATIIYENKQTGEFKSWSRPRMDVELEDGQIKRVVTHATAA